MTLQHTASGFKLLKDGKPYFIKGVGGDGDRNLLIKMGGNSFRTWGAENLGDVLDKAQEQGLTVTAGIWLGHREYFDFHNAAKVAEQLQMCREVVQKYKNHPALLMWAFGNESAGDGKDVEVYKAINDIAAMSHQEDPNHPAMTVMAEIGADKIENIGRYCPNIDIVGVNTYAPGASLAERYNKSGVQKPYIVTEFGPPGQWETAKTPWGAVIELTSTQKVKHYRATYQANVINNASMCLGSYSFLWGHKLEGTPTWFGMLLTDNKTPLGSAFAISEFWTGRKSAELAPEIEPVQIAGEPSGTPGAQIIATVEAKGATKIEWSLIEDIDHTTEDPNTRNPIVTIPNAVHPSMGSTVTVTLPSKPGNYRLMVIARNATGAATANVPLRVTKPLDN